MIKHIFRLAILALPLLPASCIKEGYDDENCPGEYTLILHNPEILGGNEMADATVTVIDGNGNQQTLPAGSNNPIDLEDGQYTVVTATGTGEGPAKVEGTTISVAAKPDGTAEDMPEGVIGGHTQITVGGNTPGQEETNFDLKTNVQSRPLVIKLTFEGNNSRLIETIAGTVSGITLSRDLNHGFTPTDGQDRHPAIEAGDIGYTFGADPETAGLYSDSHVLLGIDGDGNQTLTFTVTYEGGTQKTYTFDITSKMDGFHTEDVLKPWVIELTLRLGADFTADIEDWKAGPEEWMEAH